MHSELGRSVATAELPYPVPIAERVRRLPDALLLTLGYYASRVPALSELLRRLD